MPREYENFRPMLERIDQAFPGKEQLTINEIASFLGKHRTTVYRRYNKDLPGGRVNKVQLAKVLAKEARR